MKTINESPITTLQIIKPEIVRHYYEMKSGEEQYGSVELVNNTGTLARIETTQGIFSVKRCGFFKPFVTFRKEKANYNEAKTYLNIDGTTQIVIDKYAFHFRMINLWKNQWGWTNDKNQIILRYKPTVAGIIKGDVEFSKEFMHLPYIEAIAMLGIYFLTRLENEIMQYNETIIVK